MKPQTSKVRAHLMKTGSITPKAGFTDMRAESVRHDDRNQAEEVYTGKDVLQVHP